MLISYCLPAHKRTDDLLAVMPSVVIAANQSPPVEIVIVDYGKQPPLAPLLKDFRKSLLPENKLKIKVYRKRKYYHMALARNLAIRAATGEYAVTTSTDVIPVPGFFSSVRKSLSETGAAYLRSLNDFCIGIIVCSRKELVAVGGYDERFEFYGPEDKDLLRRLARKGVKVEYYDLHNLISLIPTPDDMKVANYRLKLSKREMSARGKEILLQNDAVGLIVANEGMKWGEG